MSLESTEINGAAQRHYKFCIRHIANASAAVRVDVSEWALASIARIWYILGFWQITL